MIVLTSVLLSLASFRDPLAFQPLVQPDEGEYKNESYFGQENSVYDEDYVLVPHTPPTPLNEPIPLPPDPTYVWTPGYWEWDEDHWTWIYGQWLQPPNDGDKWVGGYWEKRPEGWFWKKGRWKSP